MAHYTMEANTSIIKINQTLHGYKGGHKLLSASLDLTDVEKRSMLMFSDYSGSGIENKFKSYLTGYPLLSSKFYVFAKTWYADEMSRPGCVWTHSLLIDFTDLWTIKDMASLLKLFIRPQLLDDNLQYTIPLVIGTESVKKSEQFGELFYQLTCQLYTRTEQGIVLFADSSSQYESVILQMWNWQWPKMKRNFTFSTGSLSLRSYENEPFDLQLTPYGRKRSIFPTENETFYVTDIEDNGCESVWIEDYRLQNLIELQDFMVKYGSDVNGERKNFTSLFSAFLLIRNAHLSQDDVIKFFKENFTNSNSARMLKLDLIHILTKGNKKGIFSIIDLIINNKTFSKIEWDFKNLIISAWTRNQLSTEQLSTLMQGLIFSNHDENLILSILQSFTPETWIKLDIDSYYFKKLLVQNPELDKESFFWIAEKSIQEKWFRVIIENNKCSWKNIVHSMLDSHSDIFAEEIYNSIGDSLIQILIQWMEINNTKLLTQWMSILRKNPELFFNYISYSQKLNSELIRTTLNILNPYDKFWKQIPNHIIESFLFRVMKIQGDVEVAGIFTFFITAAYTDNLEDSVGINNLIFQPLHDKLKKDLVDFDSWERFKWHMGKDLYSLIEQNFLSKFFTDRNKIPDWDRCEFLRRSLLVTFLKYEWEPDNVIKAIPDRETFEKILDFGLDISAGSKLFKKMFKIIKSSHLETTFHYKILKKEFS